MTTWTRELQPLKTFDLNVVIEQGLSKIKCSNEEHLLKKFGSIEFTDEGTVNSTSDEQSFKTYFWNVVIEQGLSNVIFSSDLHELNA